MSDSKPLSSDFTADVIVRRGRCAWLGYHNKRQSVAMGPIGISEMVGIFVIALLLFGPKKLPELGRTLGKALSEFRRAKNELKSTFETHLHDLEREVRLDTQTPKLEAPSSSGPASYSYPYYDEGSAYGSQVESSSSVSSHYGSEAEGSSSGTSYESSPYGASSDTSPYGSTSSPYGESLAPTPEATNTAPAAIPPFPPATQGTVARTNGSAPLVRETVPSESETQAEKYPA